MEKLTVKNLGPIKDFTMETNRLTVLIGPQASGKSLLAQMLYFFRGFEFLLAESISSGTNDFPVTAHILDKILSSLRGTPFSSFTDESTIIDYFENKKYYEVRFRNGISPGSGMAGFINGLVTRWAKDAKQLSESANSNQIYIPTERSLYTRLLGVRRSVLYSGSMPSLFVSFVESLDYCSKYISGEYEQLTLFDSVANMSNTIDGLQEKALSGKIRKKASGTRIGEQWAWKIEKGKRGKILPIEAISSGQMEAWPFFALATVFGARTWMHDFYFEEPETHLHPNAQVEVVKAIAYLLSRGHRFVITTHSPFILYVINNLIQAHIAYDGSPPEGEFSVNPAHVAAYCLGDNPRSIVDDETKLLKLDEIDDVLDSIGKQFYDLLNQDVKKNG